MERTLSRYRRVIAVAIYGASVVLALLLGYGLHNHGLLSADLRALAVPTAVLVVLRLVSHGLYGLTTSRWRFVGTGDVVRLVLSTTVASLVFAALNRFAGWGLPWAVLVLEWVLAIFFTSAAWISYRVLFEHVRQWSSAAKGGRKNVLIVGAGEAGNLLARELVRRAPSRDTLVGFLDDDPLKAGTHVQGVRVYGPIESLPRVVGALAVDEVILAMPSVSGSDLRRIVEICEEAGVEYRVLPGIAEVLHGDVSVSQVRRVTIEDLLGRPCVDVELPALSEELTDAVVLVTGAGGSIGSELSRQIAANAPRCLLLLDQSESDLFFVDQEIRRRYPSVEVHPIVADVCDEERVAEIVARRRVTHLYHAAAYKHVPLMEENVSEAVRNNVLGTRQLLEIAGRAHLRAFVLISTDKAVRPANTMGATKRVCELLMLAAAERFPDTKYTAVRFGNVLGSNGSVVQIFRRQLETGTLTVTHPDITRYFMTVGEAVQLVLLAALMDEARGRIAMLEMGEPVRIVDLAANMIRLSGLIEGKDVRIEFTGLRPGEKLHEELVGPFETTSSTQDGRIKLVRTRGAGADFAMRCERLIQCGRQRRDGEARKILGELVGSGDLLAPPATAGARAVANDFPPNLLGAAAADPETTTRPAAAQ